MSISGLCLAQQEQQKTGQIIRVRIFTLRNISTETAKKYLTTAQIADTVVAIPKTKAISVAGKPEELVQASAILKLVDVNEPFDIQMLDISAGQSLPKLEKIGEKLGGGYSIGSLMEGPVSGAGIKAIVDIQKDKLILISPKSQTAKITETVLASMAETKTMPAKTEVASANDVNTVFITEPVVVESNQPQSESVVEVAVGGKVQTEEDKLLAEFVSELTDAAMAEKEAQKLKAEQVQAVQPAAVEPTTEIPQQEIIVQQPAKEAEKIQKPPSLESQAEQAKVEDVNIPLITHADDPNQQKQAETKQRVISVVDIPNGEELLTLDLPEKMEVVSLIELVGKYLNLNYLYDETKVTGSVTIKVQGRLKVRELYDLLESVLKFRGFVMSRKGNLVTIAPVAEALDQDPTFAGDSKAGDVIVTKVFHLQYISTEAARNLLTGMKLGSNITPIPETGTLVMTEYAFRMQRIEDLLALVDVPGPPKEFKLRVLKYTLAESLVPKVQALAEQIGTVNITIGSAAAAQPATPSDPRVRRRPTTPQSSPQAQPQTQDAAKKTGVFVDFDKRTNRVLMIGLTDEILAVDQIIDALDVPQQDLRVIYEYEMQYTDIDSVVTALKDLGIIDSAITTGGKSSISGRTSIQQPGQPPQPQPQPTQSAIGTGGETISSIDQPQVVMLITTNSLLVNATPEQHTQISQIISYVDREPVQNAIPYRIYRLENQEPEALAEVLNNLIEKTVKDKEGKIQQTVRIQEDNIAIVPDKNTFSLIVYASKKNQEWIGNLIQTLDTRRPQVLIDVSLVEVTKNDAFQFDLNLIANAKGLVTDNLQILPINASAIGGNREAGFTGATGTTKGFYSADKIQALLTLVNSNGYGRVLAQPKVLVNDNEEGTINTTSQRYVAEEVQSYPGSTTGGTSGTLVATKTWKAYDAKIELKIKPQISEGNLLRLEIEMLREDFGTKEAADAPPPKTTSNVKTIVTVPDGSTIILGGLNKLNQDKKGYKMPLLGDVPVAGGLFRGVNNSNDERRLYVFVKANISRPDAVTGLKQLKEISRKNQVEFEKSEDKFQKHEDFPGIKPAIVEPLKVLEYDGNEPDVNLPEEK